jgi:hypothetical protein
MEVGVASSDNLMRALQGYERAQKKKKLISKISSRLEMKLMCWMRNVSKFEARVSQTWWSDGRGRR